MIKDIRVVVNGPESVLVEPPYCLQRKESHLRWKTIEGEPLHFFGGTIWENQPLWEHSENLTPLEVTQGYEKVTALWGDKEEDFYQKHIKSTHETQENRIGDDFLEIALQSKKELDLHRGFLFCFAVPGEKFSKNEVLAKITFAGPSDQQRLGDYVLILRGNGWAELLSRHLDEEWISDGCFQYCASGKIGQNVHRFYIRPFAYGEIGLVSVQILSGLEQTHKSGFCHRSREIPGIHTFLSSEVRWEKGKKVCVEVSSLVRSAFKISELSYSKFSRVHEAGFCLPFHPFMKDPLKIGGLWSSGVTCNLLDDEENILKQDSENAYSPVSPKRGYESEWNIKGTEQIPGWIHSYWVQRSGVQRMELNSPFILDRVLSIDLIGADQDPDHEKGMIRFYDRGEVQNQLNYKGRVSVSIQIKKEKDWMSVFTGFIEKSQITYLESRDGWQLWECKMVGIWKQVTESFTSLQYTWKDKNPFEALKQLLTWAGFSNSMIQLPKDELPLKKIHLEIEPMTRISDLIEKLLREILGGTLLFDPSLGDMGCWRWISEKGNITNVQFTDGTSSKTPNFKYIIRKRTDRYWTIPPIANHLVVSGIEKKGDQIRKISQVLVNPHSFKIYPDQNLLSKDNIDYLGRRVSFHVFDPYLSNEKSINHVAQKIYQRTCIGKRIRCFVSDLAWENNRLVQTGDLIMIDNEIWKLKNINLHLSRGKKAKAFYEFEQVR